MSDERWVVEGAMYGLIESPKHWGDFRNSKMRGLSWEKGGVMRWLKASPEAHLWEVWEQEPQEGSTVVPSVVVGHVAVYVDDLMVVAKREIRSM